MLTGQHLRRWSDEGNRQGSVDIAEPTAPAITNHRLEDSHHLHARVAPVRLTQCALPLKASLVNAGTEAGTGKCAIRCLGQLTAREANVVDEECATARNVEGPDCQVDTPTVLTRGEGNAHLVPVPVFQMFALPGRGAAAGVGALSEREPHRQRTGPQSTAMSPSPTPSPCTSLLHGSTEPRRGRR